jgi:hypothetical protein
MKPSFVRHFRFLVLPLLVLGLANTSTAQDEKIPEITTASGKTYRDVRITKVTPSEVSIAHEAGAARIPFAELPEDLKAKLGYDPAKAEAHKQAAAKAAAEAQMQNAEAAKKAAMLKSASAIKAQVLRVHLDEGFVVVNAKQASSDSGIVVSSSQQSGFGGGGYYAPGAAQPSSKPERPRIYGYYVITNVPDLSKIADDEWVHWLVVPTDKTLQVGGMTTYKVCQYVGSDK